MHSFSIIHRDVKPENLLIDKKSASVKIIDFGLAIDEQTVSTDYIATRWYRAPENLLGTKEYSCAIDVFSLGCVIVELFLGSPLFPGANNLDQILKIFSIIGYPSEDTWPAGAHKMNELGMKPGVKAPGLDLREILTPCDSRLIDLIVRMLALNPSSRITCSEIVKHEYFKDIRSIIPPIVYQRYEQDYLGKKQLTFKGIGQQKNPRLNLHSKYFLSHINSNTNLKSKPPSTIHRSSDNCLNSESQSKRTKKSVSIESQRGSNSEFESSLLQQKRAMNELKNNFIPENRFKLKVNYTDPNLALDSQQAMDSQLSLRTNEKQPSPLLSYFDQDVKNSKTSTGESTNNKHNPPMLMSLQPQSLSQREFEGRKNTINSINSISAHEN